MTGLGAKFIDEKMDHYGHKFMVVKHQTDSERLNLYNFYSVNLYSEEEPMHWKIVKGFEEDESLVIGGGRVKQESNKIIVYDQSGKYGSVPKRFLEFFQSSLLNDFKKKYPNIEDLIINVPEKSIHDDKVGFIDALNEEIA
ncbi:hypothetical protein ACFL1H_04155 [Nanoarchaeota archaeon]